MDNATALAAAADSSDPRTGLRAVAASRAAWSSSRRSRWTTHGSMRRSGRRSPRSSACAGRPSTRTRPPRGRALTRGDADDVERFTDRGRMAVHRARPRRPGVAIRSRPVYLLHALASSEGVAARALAGLGVDAGTIERQLDRIAPLRKPLEGEPAGGDAEALATIGIDLDEIRHKVEESFGPGTLDRGPVPPASVRRAGRITMTREAKQSVGSPPRRPGPCATATSAPSTCCWACSARPSATRAATSARRPSATWASTRPGPGSASSTSCGAPQPEGGHSGRAAAHLGLKPGPSGSVCCHGGASRWQKRTSVTLASTAPNHTA